MRFITEIDLRNEFRQNPFQTYNLNNSDKLTSEAKQFLKDRDIIVIKEDEVGLVKIPNLNKDDEVYQLGSQLLYAEILEVILLAKDSQINLSEDLYSISLVIKQFSSLGMDQEIKLNYSKTVERSEPKTITLKNLFSDEGRLIASLFKLDVSFRMFKENYSLFFNEEQISQLDIISSRLRFLTGQLMGE